MSDGNDGHGARWVAIHEKKTECRRANKEALAEFRVRHAEAVRIVVGIISDVPAPAPITPLVTTPATPAPAGCLAATDPIADLWQECEKTPKIRPITELVRQNLKEAFDTACEDSEDSTAPSGPFVFDPAEGFRTVIRWCAGNAKEIERIKQQASEMERAAEKTRIDLISQLSSTQERLTNTQHYVMEQATQLGDLRGKNKEFEERIARLERTLGIYRTKYPGEDENPQPQSTA